LVEENSKSNPFKNVQEDRWNDWRWQIENRIYKISQLAGILNISLKEADKYKDVIETYRFSITPYYLSLIDISNEKDPRCSSYEDQSGFLRHIAKVSTVVVSYSI